MLDYIIHLSKGLGTVEFGTPMTKIIELLGEPDEKQLVNDELGFDVIILQYHDLFVSFFFENVEEAILTSIEVDHQDTILWEKKIFEMNEEELILLFNEHGYKLFETEVHDWGEKRVTFDEAIVDLYFENGQLNSITFGLITDASGHNFGFSLN